MSKFLNQEIVVKANVEDFNARYISLHEDLSAQFWSQFAWSILKSISDQVIKVNSCHLVLLITGYFNSVNLIKLIAIISQCPLI